MIKDITLGQFFPGHSPLHRADPRAKIFFSIFYIAAVFTASTPLSFCVLLLFSLFMVLLARISLRVVLKGLRPILFILVFTAILNIFLTSAVDEEPLFAFYFIKIYRAGILRAVYMALRVIALIVGTSVLLTYTTSPIRLTDAIESLLSPLRKLHLPVHEFAMMMTIALRFIPTLVEETDKIMSAQRSRGADFSSGGLIRRAKALIPILVPLFVSAFKRADDLAIAMECRCYRGGSGRTKMKKLRFRPSDVIGTLFYIAFFLLILFVTNKITYPF